VSAGYQVDIAYSMEAAEVLLKEIPVDVLVLDSLFCGRGEGIEFILRAKSAFPRLLIILSVCADDQAIVYELLSVGIISSWIKDAFQNKDLLSVVENVLRRCRSSTYLEPSLASGRQDSPERRKSPRKEMAVSVRWCGLGDSSPADLPWTASRARNMSLKGLMLETAGRLHIHQHIRLEICLPSQHKPIQASGQIRWVRRDVQQDQRQYGIQLMDLEEPDMIRLLDYLSA
jgi:DNA-binding response OmpR family regulator